ncbi:IS3 family transposase [Paenibacillus sp. FSL R7-0297]|uniref:IS3 family transposase n=1 Tax=unclassified Paenibacillus TaxID=185978 RepID=UPI0009DF7364|nr:IS3 family transposase [Paenibacillus sp. FSL R5-0912]
MENHRSEFRLEKMCKILQVSRSGYYKWRTGSPSTAYKLRKAAILKRINYHFKDQKGRYGSPKITRLLHQEGFTITERTVSVYMRQMKLRSIVSKTYRVQTTSSNPNHPIAPNTLNQQFKVLTPNTVWVTDITYIPCRGGRLYLASVMDLCTREIVGWRLYDHMETRLVLDALQDAYTAKRPGKGLLHHSDRGSQYTSHEYRDQLKAYHMEASMSRKGNCYDNACMESWHSLLKKELIYCNPRFKNKEQAYTALFQYIEFYYNRKRIHSALGYLSPARFAEQFNRKSVA